MSEVIPSKKMTYCDIRNRHVGLLRQLLEHTAEDEEAALRWAINRLEGLPEHWVAESPSETAATPRLETMRITYQSHGRCLWHDDCDKSAHGIMTEVSREEARSLLRCLHCGREGYLPVGITSACVPVESIRPEKAKAQCECRDAFGRHLPGCPVLNGLVVHLEDK